MQRERTLSQHPTDVAVREILRGYRPATDLSASTLAQRMASTEFNPARRRLPRPLLTLMQHHGYVIYERTTQLTHHWAKHVLGDGQWSATTDELHYLQDLVHATSHSSARLLLQRRLPSIHVAIAIASTADIVPLERLGPNSGAELVVIYSADIGKILSGYMVQEFAPASPEAETIWLRM